jgi:hypothetical protein
MQSVPISTNIVSLIPQSLITYHIIHSHDFNLLQHSFTWLWSTTTFFLITLTYHIFYDDLDLLPHFFSLPWPTTFLLITLTYHISSHYLDLLQHSFTWPWPTTIFLIMTLTSYHISSHDLDLLLPIVTYMSCIFKNHNIPVAF